MIGTKLAHYEITSHIGSGGMGEVYQATDAKLGRSVAIKFLPEAFSHNTERVARFQREARVLASLNHPNIAAIHGVEQIDTRHFLVMELVPGETLADRIKRGAIPIEEALPIAKQIAEALEEAHEKGIIHRDLKPANIKVTPDGKVKVLDFGLAKAYETETSNPNLSQSPTLSMAATNAGIILGTAAYMSPEQARGRTLDKRTDIWALGCVVYEMLTGKPVFRGEDVTEILAAVVKSEPDWSALPPATPVSIRRLLRRCLAKDQKQRLRDASDARLEIEDALTAPAAEVTPESAGRVVASNRFAWAALAAAVVMLVGLAVIHFRESPPATLQEMRVDIVTPWTPDPISFGISPDGRQIVFVASAGGPPRLWVRPISETTAQPLPGTDGASHPFWSPNSRSVGFFDGTKLKRIDVAGGSPQTLTDAESRYGGAWNSNGDILFARSVAGTLFRISAAGGEAVAVTKLDRHQVSHRFPEFLPGGRQFLFYAQGGESGIYLGSLDSPETKRLTVADTAGVYIPAGWLLFVRGGTLLARRLDLAKSDLTGDPVTVAATVTFDDSLSVAAISVSATGVVAYRAGGISRRQLTWFDRSGKPIGTVAAPDETTYAPRLSPDGRRVTVSRTVQGNSDIWILDADHTTRFTFDAGVDRIPVWSPDGTRIIFESLRKGSGKLYVKPASGAGAEELLLDTAADAIPQDWSPDGRFISFISPDPQATGWDLWMLPLDGDRKPFAFLKTDFDERRPMFSPDGRWVAYHSNESGRYEIYVRPFPGPGGQWQVSTQGGMYPRWGPGRNELFYLAPDGTMMAAPVAISDLTIVPGRPVSLFRTRILGAGTDINIGQQYDISRDGRFLINTILEDDAASPITLLLNWNPPAK